MTIIQSTFAIPLVLAFTSLFGLFAALLGNGVLHALSWASLILPILAVAWALRRRKKATKKPRRSEALKT